MTRPGKTQHERTMEHLRRAAKHLADANAKAQASLQSHLDAHPVQAFDPITTKEAPDVTTTD